VSASWGPADGLRPSDFGCGACRETFGTLEQFDAHQHWSEDWSSLTCVIPPRLVRDHRGVWQTPEGLAERAARAARLAAMRPGVRAQTPEQAPGGVS
jgi:hypothetical protein